MLAKSSRADKMFDNSKRLGARYIRRTAEWRRIMQAIVSARLTISDPDGTRTATTGSTAGIESCRLIAFLPRFSGFYPPSGRCQTLARIRIFSRYER